jgi:hypothetical protein
MNPHPHPSDQIEPAAAAAAPAREAAAWGWHDGHAAVALADEPWPGAAEERHRRLFGELAEELP